MEALYLLQVGKEGRRERRKDGRREETKGKGEKGRREGNRNRVYNLKANPFVVICNF